MKMPETMHFFMKGLRVLILLAALLTGTIRAAASEVQAGQGDAYRACALDHPTVLRTDKGFAEDWSTFERPSGNYPDGSIEGASAANVFSNNGTLHIVANKTGGSALGGMLMSNSASSWLVNHNATLRSYVTSSFNSGRVISRRSVGFGCIEFVARLPRGRGMWPALWMRTPYGQPINGEIDVVEGFGSHPGVFQSTLHHWINGSEPTAAHPRIIDGQDRTLTCARVVADTPQPADVTQTAIRKARWAGTDKWHLPNWEFVSAENRCILAPVASSLDFSHDFHRFLIVRKPDQVIWAIDGKPYFETKDGVPQAPLALVMNLSVGKMDGYPDATTPRTNELQVRSVRLYELAK